MRIEGSTKLRKAKNIHWKAVDGEAVLLNFGTGDYFALDPIGTFLWSKISENPLSFEELIKWLMVEYNCNKETADKDLRDFCGSLVAEKLLELLPN